MKRTKKTVTKQSKEEEEAVTPEFLAVLAAKFVPDLCFNSPNEAIKAAARLIECAREWVAMMPHAEDEKAQLADEKAQLEALAKDADKYEIKLTGENLSLGDAFRLQSEERFWKGKRREGPYKTEKSFVTALRREKLTWRRSDETPEETTRTAVEALFEKIKERRRVEDKARKKRVK